MPKIAYKNHRFNANTLAQIEQAAAIIEEYREAGFVLTLRQLFYQFVARDLIPNTQRSYKQLGQVVANARMAGMLDWLSIEDRTRWLRERNKWSSPEKIIGACAKQYHRDLWVQQDYRPEVWIEKDALVGVIEEVCNRWDVPFFACRGYGSLSELWVAGQRMSRWIDQQQEPIVFHLGDHDPSGIDMTRDIAERLETFCDQRIEVRRLALNMDQIEEYGPPSNPAKLSDSRANGYVDEFGNESWELDALEPQVIVDLIDRAILSIVDSGLQRREEQREERERAQIGRVAQNWRSIVRDLEKS